MDWELFILSSLLYGLAVLLAFGQLLRRRQPPHSAVFIIVLAGFAVQTVGLYVRGMENRSCPIGNTFEVLQFISWSSILLFLVTGPVFRLSLFGAATATIAATLSGISFAVPAWDGVRRSFFGGDPWVETHAAVALLSYGVFAVLAAVAILFLLQDYGLRRKRLSNFLRFLPAIYEMETVMTRLLWIAVLAFTSAVAIGVWYFAANPEAIRDLKLLFTLLLWAGYIGLLLWHLTGQLVYRTMAWFSIGLFLFALLTLWPVEINRGRADSGMKEPVAIQLCLVDHHSKTAC